MVGGREEGGKDAREEQRGGSGGGGEQRVEMGLAGEGEGSELVQWGKVREAKLCLVTAFGYGVFGGRGS